MYVQTKFSGSLGFDADEVARWAEQHGARSVRREYAKKGYEHALSLYGTIMDQVTGEGWTPRIEVLSKVMWTEEIVSLIYNFFNDLKPRWYYSVWIYSDKIKAVKNVWKIGGP